MHASKNNHFLRVSADQFIQAGAFQVFLKVIFTSFVVIVVFIHANGQGSKTEDFCQEIYSSGASSLSMKTISINVYQKHAVKGSCICVIATSHVKYVWYARELRFMITKFSRVRATEGKN